MTDADLESLYAYPPDRTWVTANFVSSVDGAVTVDGRSAGLGSPADTQIYLLGWTGDFGDPEHNALAEACDGNRGESAAEPQAA